MNIQSYQDVLDALHRFTDGDAADSPKARKRRRILTAAAELFQRHGYRRTSMSEVARQAAVAKGTVYLYYAGKAELLLHVIMRERAQLYERMAPVLNQEQRPRERLRALLQQAVVHAEAMPISNRVKAGDQGLVAALSELDLTALMPSVQLFDSIFGWLIQAATPGELGARELHDRGHVLMALLQGLPIIAHGRQRGGMSREIFGGLLADMLVEGIAAPPRYPEREVP